MTKVTYLDHSGFAVTLPDAVLVFDHFNDHSHALHKILDSHPYAPVIFFVSHKHQDHFNTGIFEMAQNHQRIYVMSNDIPADHIPSTLDVAGMSAGDVVGPLPGGITVKAYPSTDEGVSFLVTLKDGKKIFHAGDLNLWHWTDESTPKEVKEAELKFEKAVHRIASENPVIDVVMFPVDARQGTDFAKGAHDFLQAVQVGNFFPMHFWGQDKEACDFQAYRGDSKAQFHCLATPGQSIDIDL